MKKQSNRVAIYLPINSRHPDDSAAAQRKAIRRHARQRGLKIIWVATDGES